MSYDISSWCSFPPNNNNNNNQIPFDPSISFQPKQAINWTKCSTQTWFSFQSLLLCMQSSSEIWFCLKARVVSFKCGKQLLECVSCTNYIHTIWMRNTKEKKILIISEMGFNANTMAQDDDVACIWFRPFGSHDGSLDLAVPSSNAQPARTFNFTFEIRAPDLHLYTDRLRQWQYN